MKAGCYQLYREGEEGEGKKKREKIPFNLVAQIPNQNCALKFQHIDMNT